MVAVFMNKCGRPLKGLEKRKAVTFRLTPSSIDKLKHYADISNCSQSDFVELWLSSLF